MARAGRPVVRFGLDASSRDRDFGLVGGSLAEGARPFLPVAQLPIHGLHNAANALAASALARTLGVSLEQIAGGLRTFRGLPHRLQLVAQRGGVDWYDDSKGTNVGATIAA
jgi:UDP-N-acetylmuramoylalanine--D-glutamate ligase